jgi:hypothetical protein
VVRLQGKALCITIAIFAVVVGLTFLLGMIGDASTQDKRHFTEAEILLEDVSAMAVEIPRLPNGAILRQGQLSSAWLDESDALPERLQAMAGSLRGQQARHSLGLVTRGPGAYAFSLEAKDSLIWTTVLTLSKAVCLQMVAASMQHSDQIAFITTSGDLPAPPYMAEPPVTCRSDFINFRLITINPVVELRRLSDDIEKAVAAFSNSSQDKILVSGTSAPFQVGPHQEGGTNYIERNGSGIRMAIDNVPLAVCRLALLAGPRAFGMDNFQSTDGHMMKPPDTLSAAGALCEAQNGKLLMNRL